MAGYDEISEWAAWEERERFPVTTEEQEAEARYYAALQAEAEREQADAIAAEEARLARLVQVGPYTYADPQCKFCRGTGVVTDSVPYGMGNVGMDSPCECAVDYEWAVTDGDGIAITHGAVTATAAVVGGVPQMSVVTVLGGSVGVTEFPTVAAVEDTPDGLRVELAGEDGSGMVVVR
jgi:hypothetical protein